LKLMVPELVVDYPHLQLFSVLVHEFSLVHLLKVKLCFDLFQLLLVEFVVSKLR
jgi:hypothetical protein